MPKTPNSKNDSATTPGPMGSASHPNVLKRNQVRPRSSVIFLDCCSTRLSFRHVINAVDANSYVFFHSGSPATYLFLFRLFRNGNCSSNSRSSLHVYPCNSDAQRPCSTCVRSHAHALSHAPAGLVLPERPECTFDDGIAVFVAFIECGVLNW